MMRRFNLLNTIGYTLLLLSTRNSDAFLVQRRRSPGSLSSSPSLSSRVALPVSNSNSNNNNNRKASGVALQSQKTNVTTLLDYFDEQDQLSYDFEEAKFLQQLEQQLAGLQTLQQEVSTTSPTVLLPDGTPTTTITNTDATMVPQEAQDEQAGNESELWKARFLLIGAAALYGTNFSLVKLLGDTMPVGVSTTLRFGLAALATLPWLIGNANRKGALTAAWLGFEVGLWTSIGYVAQAVGLETTPASESAFICSLAVVTVPLLDCMAGKKLLPRQWTGAILAVLGVAFLELGDLFIGSSGSAATMDATASSMMTTGDMLSLIQPFAFGMGFWRMEHAMQRFPEEAPRMTASQLFAVFLSSLAYGLWAIDMPTLQSYPWGEWFSSYDLLFSLFWTGVITTALTIYMETLAMKTLSAAETTLIFSTEPLWGTAFAALIMGEQLGMNVGVGAAFILTACLYSNLGAEGIQSIVTSAFGGRNGISEKNTNTTTVTGRRPLRVQDLPAALQRQWIWVTSGLTANLATWSSAVQGPNNNNNGNLLEEVQDALEEFIHNFMM